MKKKKKNSPCRATDIRRNDGTKSTLDFIEVEDSFGEKK